MDLEVLGSIGDFVGGLGVVVSLLYLAVQIRQNTRANAADQALIFGFENMLRLREEGLIDLEVWQNIVANSAPVFAAPGFRKVLAARPGLLSRRFVAAVDEFVRVHPELRIVPPGAPAS